MVILSCSSILQLKPLSLANPFLHGSAVRTASYSFPSSSGGQQPMEIKAMRSLQGKVVCSTNDKTVAVEVVRLAPHPKYKRRVKKKKTYQAHDPLNQFKVGDFVRLEKHRPISKTKTFWVIPAGRKTNAEARPEDDANPLQELSIPMESINIPSLKCVEYDAQLQGGSELFEPCRGSMGGEGAYEALERSRLSSQIFAVEGEPFNTHDGKAVKDVELVDEVVAVDKETGSAMASIPAEVMEQMHFQEEEACEIRSARPVYVATDAAESLGAGDKNEEEIKMERFLREARDREIILVRTLEELRLTLSRTQEEAVHKEDMFRRDIEDLQKQYQASRRQCEELISQAPDFNRPLLRQFEAMQETIAKRAETWAAVERTLKLRLQEAEAKAAAAEEKESYATERLTQTLARLNVMETQLSSLRTEQTQLRRYLEKERQEAADHRLKCLALKRELEAKRVCINQLDEEIRRLKRKHEKELLDAQGRHERLQQELKQEMASYLVAPVSPGRSLLKVTAALEDGSASHPSSLSCIGESSFRRTIVGTFDNGITRKVEEDSESLLFTASVESIRDNLAQKLSKVTAQCEKLKAETAALPGMRAELKALKLKHSVALELIGERDEELEVLREDMVEMKNMYAKQVNQLMDKIRVLSSETSIASSL